MVTFNRPAWHAGSDSTWYEHLPAGGVGAAKLERMNFHTLGVEIDNYGPLTKVGSKWRTWFGRDVPSNEVAEVDPAKPGSFKTRYWHAYSEAQLAVVERLAVVLAREFKLKGILGHSDVSPGRKMDPGPVFPMSHLRALVSGRGDDDEVSSVLAGEGANGPPTEDTTVDNGGGEVG
jgi:N-acetylmuramoyl-L-alanine amidase